MPWSEISKQQSFVCHLLQRSLEHRRLHHGYLFVGEDMETDPLAKAFAQALNCDRNQSDFCGQCESCMLIAKNQHPDVHALRPESKSRRILIHQIRELERAVYLKASRARTKVAMIHGADRLQPEAQDAFLKTLEEPPVGTIFLLLTEEPQQLKETVLSRCLRIPFRPSQSKKKSPYQEKVKAWLEEWVDPKHSAGSAILKSYGFTGKVLGLLKEMKEEKLKEAEIILENPSIENLESSQKERLKEEIAAQAQAEYLQERSRLLKTILEWFHHRNPNIEIVRILETLSRQLSRNVHEPLAWEVATLELAKQKV